MKFKINVMFTKWVLVVTCSCCPYLYFGSTIMLVTYFVNFRQLNDHLFGKELFQNSGSKY